MTDVSPDVIIVGGGIMGSALAYGLKSMDPGVRTLVVERDPTYQYASTALSMANVRLQFSLKENILISQYAMDVFQTFGPDLAVDGDQPEVAFRREGNLFLFDQSTAAEAEAALELQRSLGCPSTWLSADEIKARYPLYEPGDLPGGVFDPGAGHIDAYAVLMGYKNKARDLGAEYRAGEAASIEVSGGRTTGVTLTSGQAIQAPVVVNCAGAWAADLAATAGIDLPIAPVARHVFVLDTKVKPEGPLPLTVLPSGLYFRTETGGTILLGKSMDDDPQGYNFTWDRDRFQELLWPELAEFVPAFDTLKLIRGWAGLYAVNRFDGNAFLGPWPGVEGLYLANGFSGHGLQQGPAVGRYLAELILDRSPTLDLSVFSPRRLLDNRPVGEHGLV